jgi:two-component system KDP operon response regulator KdpE
MTATDPVTDVLIVEDEAHIRKFLRISLETHHYQVREARLGAEGLQECMKTPPDLVILDLGLPDMDGTQFIARVREWSDVPIIVLSVRAAESQKVAALNIGANDYVTKPFGLSELMARVRVLLRNRKSLDTLPTLLESDGLRVNLQTREVSLSGTPLKLTRKEYDLLRLLLTHPGQVLTHEQILREIWGPSHEQETHYLRVLVRQLRNKLGDDPASPRHVITVQGIGYRSASGEEVMGPE